MLWLQFLPSGTKSTNFIHEWKIWRGNWSLRAANFRQKRDCFAPGTFIFLWQFEALLGSLRTSLYLSVHTESKQSKDDSASKRVYFTKSWNSQWAIFVVIAVVVVVFIHSQGFFRYSAFMKLLAIFYTSKVCSVPYSNSLHRHHVTFQNPRSSLPDHLRPNSFLSPGPCGGTSS